jgi:hypothetical protein
MGGDIRRIKFVHELRVLWKHGSRKDGGFPGRNGRRSLRAMLKKAVQRNIETKRLSRHCRERLFRIGHESNLSLWIGLEQANPGRQFAGTAITAFR